MDLGPGVVRLFKSDKIENSPLGYLILERLNPLPKRIETPYELQDITEAIMTVRKCISRIFTTYFFFRLWHESMTKITSIVTLSEVISCNMARTSN